MVHQSQQQVLAEFFHKISTYAAVDHPLCASVRGYLETVAILTTQQCALTTEADLDARVATLKKVTAMYQRTKEPMQGPSDVQEDIEQVPRVFLALARWLSGRRFL